MDQRGSAGLEARLRALLFVIFAIGASAGCGDGGPTNDADAGFDGGGDAEVPECTGDGDCTDGECVEHACVPHECSGDGDCTGGECVENECVPYECIEDGDCTDGECVENECVPYECVVDDDCTDGECVEHACVPYECIGDGDCTDGECVENECVPYECVIDDDCTDGECVEHACVPYECVDDEGCNEGTCVDNVCVIPPGPCVLGVDVDTVQEAIDDEACTRVDVPAGQHTALGVTVSRSIEIRGAGSETSTLTAGGNGRIVDQIDPSAELTLTGLTLTGGDAMIGGAIYSTEGGSLSLDEVIFEGNEATEKGGAIYIEGGSLAGADCRFVGNEASANGLQAYVSGGAVAAEDAQLSFERCHFEDNVAALHSVSGAAYYGARGGAVFVDGGALDFADGSFARNSVRSTGSVATYRFGGAVYGRDAQVTVSGSAIEDNHVEATTGCTSGCGPGRAGAFYLDGGDVSLQDSVFEKNVAASALGLGIAEAGAVSIANAPTLHIARVDFIDNTAFGGSNRSAGALRLRADVAGATPVATIEDTRFHGNAARCEDDVGQCDPTETATGGAVTVSVLRGHQSVRFDRVSGSGNEAIALGYNTGGGFLTLGGGADGTTQVEIVNSTLSGNVSESQGGAIHYSPGGTEASVAGGHVLRLFNTTIAENSGTESLHLRGSTRTDGAQIVFEAQNSILLGAGNVCLFNASVEASSLGWLVHQGAPDCALITAGTGDIVTSDPVVEPLADNGGGTLTHALVSGSPVISGGEPGGCTKDGEPIEVDQRSSARGTANCTPGAYSD